jgi:arylsulfatase A-like enzyme
VARALAGGLLACLLGAALAGCGAREPLARHALVDPHDRPEILTESRVLDFPPSQAATRFVRGWWGWREGYVLRMVPYARPSRIQIATLDPRPRTLTFLTKVNRLPETGKVDVLIGGERVAELPLDPKGVELPPLPIGRAAVDFLWPDGCEIGIERAELEQALPAGAVKIEGEQVRQSGWSAVDFVRPVPAGARLRGAFTPPSPARDEQSFEVIVERDGQAPTTVFAWPAPWFRAWGGHDFDVPLGPEAGLTRVRLLARGTGEPALWESLAVAAPPPPPAPPPTPPAPPKLVLLYVMDALRADRVGHLGGPESSTPVIDRLAAEGVTFLDHQSLAPNTLPSTKTLFTGRAVIESNRKRLSPDGPPLLAELFQTAGFHTALLSGNGFVSHFYGVDRGFEHQDDSVLYEFHPKTEHNENAQWINEAAADWLTGLEPDARVFLYLHVVHPHNPYDPPPPFRRPELEAIDSTIDGDSTTLLQVRDGKRETSAADRRRLRALYEGGLAYGDAKLGELLDVLSRRYRPGEALVLVTSDHGEELFDHDGVLHGFTLYRDQLHIPLVAWWPGTLAPRRIDTPTTTQDLYVTLRRLTGDAATEALSGRSLWPLMLGVADPDWDTVRFAAAPGVSGGIYSAQSPRRKLVWAPRTGSQWGMGEGAGRSHEAEYVFDLRDDPQERRNLAGEPSLETDWLRARLLAWIDLARALQPGGETAELDDAMRANLRALGYLD